jgi:hypothetical protein
VRAATFKAGANCALHPSQDRLGSEGARQHHFWSAEEKRRLLAGLTPAAGQGPPREGITLADLTLFSCRWPIGDPHDLATFRYCGEAAPCGGPYCKCHARLAYLRRKGGAPI